MAFVIVDSCVACEACMLACPRKAVVPNGGLFRIDGVACDECRDRVDMPPCLQVCPADCISPAMDAGTLCDSLDRPRGVPVPFPKSRFQAT